MVAIGPAIHRALSGYAAQSDISSVPIDVEVIKHVVCGYSQVDEISIHYVDIETKHVWGQVRFTEIAGNYGPEKLVATIYLKKSMNLCWRRFVACKEIMHCVLDQRDRDFVGNMPLLNSLGEGLVNNLLKAFQNDGPCETELDAEIMATEVLFPLEMRETYVERYRQGLLTDLQIATRFRIPELMVRSAMAPTYIEAVQAARTERVQLPPATKI